MATKKPVAKKVEAKPAAKKPAKVAAPDVEISPPFQMTDKWTFRCNDEVVTKSVFESIIKDHEQWTIEQAKAAAAADLPEKKTRKKK